MSGMSNVNFYLRSRGIEPTRELEEEILQTAKQKKSVLSEDEVLGIAHAHIARVKAQLERAARGLEPARPDHPGVSEGGETGGF